MNNGSIVQSNSNSFFGIKVSNPGINVNNATDSQLQYLNNYSQEIFYANGAANVLIGARPANAFNGIGEQQEGFFVAQSGVDVRNATDNQMIFNSSQNVFKIVATIPMTVTIGSYDHTNPTTWSGTQQIAHGLDYVPAFQAYISYPDSLASQVSISVINHPNPATLFGSIGAGVAIFAIAEISIDATNVDLNVQLSGIFTDGSYTITGTAYLLQETF